MKHRTPSSNGSAMVWPVVVLVLGTLACVVLLAVLAPVNRLDNLVVQVLGVIAPTLAVLVTLRQVGEMRQDVRDVQTDTHALTNGLLDAKVRAATAEVLPDELLDPDYRAYGRTEDLRHRDSMDPDVDVIP